MLHDGADRRAEGSHTERGRQSGMSRETHDEFNSVEVFVISFGEVLEGIHITMPYTIAAYMVRDFLRGGHHQERVDEEVVGRLTGLLASIFCAAQFVTSYGWGVFSDKYGRKPVLLMSIISGAVSALIFGMAGNYMTAALARLAGGLLNATGGIVKTMLADTCSSRTLPRALGYLGLAWGLGTMVGPFLGGALANPCTSFGSRFPFCHPGGIFMVRPYLLPCAAASFLGLCATLMSCFAVRETLPALRRDRPPEQGDVEMASAGRKPGEGESLIKPGADRMRRPSARSFLDYQDESGSDSDDSFVSIAGSMRHMLQAVPPSPRPPIMAPSSPSLTSRASAPGTPRSLLGGAAGAAARSQPLSDISNHVAATSGSPVRQSGSNETEVDNNAGAEVIGTAGSKVNGPAGQQQSGSPDDSWQQVALQERALLLGSPESTQSCRPWYRDKQVLLALVGYAIVSFLFNLLDEVRPIFASAPIEDGGLDMSTEALAWPLSFGGLSFILYVCLGYNMFYRAVGGVWCSRIGMLAVIPTALLAPLATIYGRRPLIVQAHLCFSMAVNAFADLNAYSGSNVLLNAAGPSDAAGAVNGAGQAVSALMRAIGPTIGGFSWSASISLHVPGQQYLVFFGAALLAFCSQFMYAYVDLPNLDHECQRNYVRLICAGEERNTSGRAARCGWDEETSLGGRRV